MMNFIVIMSIVLVVILYLMFYYPSYEITKQIPAVCTENGWIPIGITQYSLLQGFEHLTIRYLNFIIPTVS